MINQQPCSYMIEHAVREWWNSKIEQRCYNNHELGCSIKSVQEFPDVHRLNIYANNPCRFAKLYTICWNMIEQYGYFTNPVLHANSVVTGQWRIASRAQSPGYYTCPGHHAKKWIAPRKREAWDQLLSYGNWSMPHGKFWNSRVSKIAFPIPTFWDSKIFDFAVCRKRTTIIGCRLDKLCSLFET